MVVDGTPFLKADPTPDGFRVGLYLEHVEELSFLFEQRERILEDPESGWMDPERIEARIEAHLDALDLGGALAEAVCLQAAPEDPGALQALIRVLCRHRNRGLLETVLLEWDRSNPSFVKAATTALCHELPREWADLPGAFLSDRQDILPILLQACGFRRIAVEGGLLRDIRKCGAVSMPIFLEALGRFGNPLYCDGIHRVLLESAEDETRTAAVMALLRLGDRRAVTYCESHPSDRLRSILILGAAGHAVTGRSSRSALQTMASENTPANIRESAYWELCIRFGIVGPWEKEMFVAEQRSVFRAMESRVSR